MSSNPGTLMGTQNKDFDAGLQMYWLSVEQAVEY